MEHIDIILFALFVIAVISIAFATFKFVNFIEEYYDRPEDKTGLYDFIRIKDYIINVDHITSINRVKEVSTNNAILIIEMDDNKEAIVIDFKDNFEDCNDAFEQLHSALDACHIITDEVQ